MLAFNNDIICIAKSKMLFKIKWFTFFNIIEVVYFVNSKTILSEGNIVIKDGQRSKTMLLEE